MLMKSTVRSFVAGLIVAAPLVLPVSVHAQAADASIPSPIIAVVDVDQIILQSAAGKSVRSQADKYQQSFQEATSKEEAKLRASQQEIEQQRKNLSPEAFAEKARAFDGNVAEFQRTGMARRRAFDKSVNTAMGQVQQIMLQATSQVASAHGASMVLPRSQVLFFADKMNITTEIIAAMDKTSSHVDFPAPKVEAEAVAEAPSRRPAKSKQ